MVKRRGDDPGDVASVLECLVGVNHIESIYTANTFYSIQRFAKWQFEKIQLVSRDIGTATVVEGGLKTHVLDAYQWCEVNEQFSAKLFYFEICYGHNGQSRR